MPLAVLEVHMWHISSREDNERPQLLHSVCLREFSSVEFTGFTNYAAFDVEQREHSYNQLLPYRRKKVAH